MTRLEQHIANLRAAVQTGARASFGQEAAGELLAALESVPVGVVADPSTATCPECEATALRAELIAHASWCSHAPKHVEEPPQTKHIARPKATK